MSRPPPAVYNLSRVNPFSCVCRRCPTSVPRRLHLRLATSAPVIRRMAAVTIGQLHRVRVTSTGHQVRVTGTRRASRVEGPVTSRTVRREIQADGSGRGNQLPRELPGCHGSRPPRVGPAPMKPRPSAFADVTGLLIRAQSGQASQVLAELDTLLAAAHRQHAHDRAQWLRFVRFASYHELRQLDRGRRGSGRDDPPRRALRVTGSGRRSVTRCARWRMLLQGRFEPAYDELARAVVLLEELDHAELRGRSRHQCRCPRAGPAGPVRARHLVAEAAATRWPTRCPTRCCRPCTRTTAAGCSSTGPRSSSSSASSTRPASITR